MRYGSVCSGIEAASVAWRPLGWRASFLSEIDAFPRAVLAHHYPAVPLHGDFTTIEKGQFDAIDLLVGGTPCQSFSVAGLRAGLDDERGNLALEFCRLARRLGPRWVVWENVPGVLSMDGGRAFASILGGLADCGYGLAYRVLDAQFVRVDGFGRAVPQRRRRVFVVGHLGDWRRAAAVLFERESLCGNPAPRREAGQGFAHDVVSSLVSSGRGVERSGETRGQDPVIACRADVAHALRADGFDASEDGTGRGTPLVPLCFDETQITSADNRCNPQPGDPSHPLVKGGRPPTLAFNARQDPDVFDGHTGPLDTDGSTQALLSGWRVRRLTPTECERLQGFPDGYTAVRYRGKPAADGPRYKALGNSMAVNVMRWIGRRIEMVEAIEQRRAVA